MTKGKSTALKAVAVVMCVLVVALCVSVGLIASQMLSLKKLVSESEESAHSIYDDSAVVKAFGDGKTDKLSEEDKFVLDTAKGVIKDVIKDDMSEYEKEKAIYDWQRAYIGFDDTNTSAIEDGDDPYTPYLVFKTHNAICVGNATTFKLFMDLLGIDCKIIHSTAEGEHAWNMVKIDGEWYHCDVTFDQGTNDSPAYAYFNVPDSVIDSNGYDYDTSEYPAATSVKNCYIYNNATDVKDLYKIPSIIKKAMDDGKTAVYIRYAGEASKSQTSCDRDEETLSDANKIVSYVSDTYFSDGDTFISLTEQPFGDNQCVGVISVEHSEEEPEPEDNIDYDRLDTEAQKAFGENAKG